MGEGWGDIEGERKENADQDGGNPLLKFALIMQSYMFKFIIQKCAIILIL